MKQETGKIASDQRAEAEREEKEEGSGAEEEAEEAKGEEEKEEGDVRGLTPAILACRVILFISRT